MSENFSNLGSSLLAVDMDDSQLTMQVVDADDLFTFFPLTGNFRVIVDDEFILVGARTGNTFDPITREAEDPIGRTASAHLAGTPVVQVLTVGGFTQGVTDIVESFIMSGSGAPEGVVSAAPTTLYRDTTNNELYIKGGGTGNTGWAAITHAAATAHVGYGALTSGDDHTQYVLDSIVDAKGDILVGTAADTIARLPVGTNGKRLRADSTQTTGVKWA